jgi:hypothetical protein
MAILSPKANRPGLPIDRPMKKRAEKKKASSAMITPNPMRIRFRFIGSSD